MRNSYCQGSLKNYGMNSESVVKHKQHIMMMKLFLTCQFYSLCVAPKNEKGLQINVVH